MADAPLSTPMLGRDAELARPLLGYALVVAATALWAVNAAVAKVIVSSGGLSSLRLAEVRAAGAAAVLLAAVAVLRPASLRARPRELGFLAVFGVAGLAFVHFLYFFAISRLDIGVALVIQYLAPVLVALWARLVIREPVRRRLWLAIAVSLAGLSLVVELPGGASLDGAGVAASLGAAVAYTVYVLMAEEGLRRGRDVYSLLAWGFLFATLFWTLAQPWWTFPGEIVTRDVSLLGRLDAVSAPVWLLLLSVVLLGTVVPFALMVTALHHVAATRVTVVAMTEPVLGAVVGFAWLGEELGAQQIAGGVLVLGGIALAQTARAATRSRTASEAPRSSPREGSRARPARRR